MFPLCFLGAAAASGRGEGTPSAGTAGRALRSLAMGGLRGRVSGRWRGGAEPTEEGCSGPAVRPHPAGPRLRAILRADVPHAPLRPARRLFGVVGHASDALWCAERWWSASRVPHSRSWSVERSVVVASGFACGLKSVSDSARVPGACGEVETGLPIVAEHQCAGVDLGESLRGALTKVSG